MVIAKIVDEIEEYIPEIREYREKISDTTIHEVFTEYLMDKSEFISDLMNIMGIELPSWIIIDEDRTLKELMYRGSEHIEFNGLIFPDWCLEIFLKELDKEEFLKELDKEAE